MATGAVTLKNGHAVVLHQLGQTLVIAIDDGELVLAAWASRIVVPTWPAPTMNIFISLRKLSLAAVGCGIWVQSAFLKGERMRLANFGGTVDYVLEHAPCRVMVVSAPDSPA